MANEGPYFYVSAICGNTWRIVSGPYETHDVALAEVPWVTVAALARDRSLCFWSWGTCRSEVSMPTPLGSERRAPARKPDPSPRPEDEASRDVEMNREREAPLSINEYIRLVQGMLLREGMERADYATMQASYLAGHTPVDAFDRLAAGRAEREGRAGAG